MALHHKRIRSALLGASALAGAASLALAAPALAQERQFQFDMPAQPLGEALKAYGSMADQPIIFAESLVRDRSAPAVQGSYTADEGLSLLLAGTGLVADRTPTGVIAIRSIAQDPQGGSAGGYDNAVEALIVTAQKKEEQIQDVPIAISAFTQKSLDAQKIEGGFDLLKAIPNVTFSKNNFSGYNFSIRGIGTKAISATTDPGVAVSFNNTTLIVNRLFEQEYFDVERVEVLRGPQGTLYGRNATSGVINVISARPRMMEFEGDLEIEAGNYNAQRVRGMVNIPIGDTLAIRAAGALTKRDGYGINEAAGTANDFNNVSADVDDRDLWSTRITVGWEPIEQVRVNALWERFEEDDNRVRTSKQLCHHDPGPRFVGDEWDWETDAPGEIVQRAGTSQGCLPGSLYDTGTVSDPSLPAGEAHGAFGTPNGASLPFVSGLFWGPLFGTAGFGFNPFYDNPLTPAPGLLPAPCPEMGELTFMLPLDLCQPDPYGRLGQSRDLRTISSLLEPVYRAKSDIFELSIDVDITDALTFTSQTVYAEDSYYASQDYNRYTTLPVFADSSIACASFLAINGIGPCDPGTFAGGAYNLTPRDPTLPVGAPGIFNDPQLGASSSLVAQDISRAESEQFNQEFRLASNFDGRVNFSLGANFTRFETLNDYFVVINALSLLSQVSPFRSDNSSAQCTSADPTASGCFYIDPNPLASIDGQGHNYFRSANPYELTSSAIFGELYWQATDTLKVTGGLRMTWDQKIFTPVPSQLLLHDYRIHVPEGAGPEACIERGGACDLTGTGINLGRGTEGYPADPDIIQEWREPTGRVIVDWKPDLAFTDETMLYASYAHGYKGGGANPPGISAPAGLLNGGGNFDAPATFEPEFIDAYEIGTKNTLLDGALILNSSAFYYDYEGYQVSKIVDRSAANENFDAKIWGLELEWIFSPTRNLRFNGTVGALRTEIAEGERSIDLMDRTQGGHHDSWIDADGVEHALAYDEWMIVKPWITNSSNCVVPVEIVETIFLGEAPGTIDGSTRDLISVCPGGGITGNQLNSQSFGFDYDPAVDAPNGGAGFFDELGGNELPNAPHWTASLGAQYRLALPGGWDATLRGDFYWQSQSYARVYNTQYDKLRAWTNTNLSLWVENPEWGVTAEVYVKNVFDETPITDAFLNSDDSGLTTNVFTLDPRLVGVSVRKSF